MVGNVFCYFWGIVDVGYVDVELLTDAFTRPSGSRYGYGRPSGSTVGWRAADDARFWVDGSAIWQSRGTVGQSVPGIYVAEGS